MTKVLLTGASGFVGRQVAKSLIASGAQVTAISRSNTPLPEDLQDVLPIQDLFSQDTGFWLEACQGFDAVVNVAWYAEPGKYLTSDKNLDCLAGTLAMARGAVQAGVRKFVGVGTCFEYDLATEALKDATPLSIDAPLKPTTLYGAAKASTWLTLSEYLKTCDVDFAWCRLFYLFGEGEDERRLVPYLNAKLAAGEPVDLTSGKQVRDFMDVSEAGNQIAQAALGQAKGALNICSGTPITVADVARNVAKEYGREDLLRFGVRPDNLLDPPYVVGVPSLHETG